MRQDMIISGVGGQGLLTIAAVVGAAALSKGMHIKQSEVHGMAQRGGAVLSHLRISDEPIASDLIPAGSADMLLSTEPMEALRYLPMLKSDGWLISNRNSFNNISNYPDMNMVIGEIEKWPKHLSVDADALAKEAGAAKAVNIVMLGAASSQMVLSAEVLIEQITQFFARKGEAVVAKNKHAFELGRSVGL